MFTSYYIIQLNSTRAVLIVSSTLINTAPLWRILDSFQGGNQEYFHHNMFLLASRGHSFHIGLGQTTTFMQ